MPLSQLTWEAVRPVLGERVDAILKHLGVETRATPIATVPGKTPGVASVATEKPKRQDVRSRQASRSRPKVEPRRVRANRRAKLTPVHVRFRIFLTRTVIGPLKFEIF